MAHTHKAKICVWESYLLLTHTHLFKAERRGPDWADTHDQAGSTPSVNSSRLFCISANCTGWGGKPPNNTVMAALVTPTCKSPAVTGCSGKTGKGLNSFSSLWGDHQCQGAGNCPWLLVIAGVSRISCTFIKRNFKKLTNCKFHTRPPPLKAEPSGDLPSSLLVETCGLPIMRIPSPRHGHLTSEGDSVSTLPARWHPVLCSSELRIPLEVGSRLPGYRNWLSSTGNKVINGVFQGKRSKKIIALQFFLLLMNDWYSQYLCCWEWMCG